MIPTNLLLRSNKLFLVVFAAISIHGNSQQLQDYKNAYPDFNEIILHDKQTYSFTIENKKLKILQDNYYESMILSEYGIHNNVESFSYSELVKLNSYDAYSVVTDKGKERKIKVSQSNEKNSASGTVFYDNVKERQLTFPNLEAGAKKVYNYQREFVDPFLLHKFMFGNSLPVQNSSFEVIVGKEINIGFKIFNDPNHTIKFERTERKGKQVYTWTLNDVKPFKWESNSPGVLHSIPHIDVYIKDYQLADTKFNVLDRVDNLYDYYRQFVVDLNKTDSKTLREFAIALTGSAKNDAEKVKKIFYWVKDNIKYIAFENGYEGFIPREATLVYERKFGDCKDMASIITAMCKYANVDNVHLSWIGTREIPYSYEELSTPAVDNHMIAIYDNGSDYIFLDATDKATRYGIPTAFIQGKEALINYGDTYKIVKVPVVAADQNKTLERVAIKIENDKIVGSSHVAYSGFQRSNILQQIGDAANKARYEHIKSLVTKGNNKFDLVEYIEHDIDNRDMPYSIDYRFRLGNYVVKTDTEMFINLNLDKYFEKYTIEKNRVAPFEFEFVTFSNSRYELEIPVTYKLKFAPKPLRIDNSLFDISIKYEQLADKLILVTDIKMKSMRIDPSDFALWNETIKTLKNYYNELVILTLKK